MAVIVELTQMGENKARNYYSNSKDLKRIVLIKLYQNGQMSIKDLEQSLYGSDPMKVRLALRSLTKRGYVKAIGDNAPSSDMENY